MKSKRYSHVGFYLLFNRPKIQTNGKYFGTIAVECHISKYYLYPYIVFAVYIWILSLYIYSVICWVVGFVGWLDQFKVWGKPTTVYAHNINSKVVMNIIICVNIAPDRECVLQTVGAVGVNEPKYCALVVQSKWNYMVG